MNSIQDSTGQLVAPLRQHFVQITGALRINGKEASSIRAAELLHMVASGGGRLARSTIEKVLYGGFCSRSSLWYPLKICQESGIDIHYDKATRSVVLHDAILFDYDVAVNYLRQGNPQAAIWVLNGWPFASSTDSYAESLTTRLREEFLAAQPNIYRSEIEDTFEVLDTKCRGHNTHRTPHYSSCIH